MYKHFILILAIITMSCKRETKVGDQHGFKIEATAKNFPDSTKVYLYEENLEVKLDSTYVLNERFNFSGKVDLPSFRYLFFHDHEDKRIEDYKYLFIENTAISIDGEYLDFFNANVTGSAQSDLLQKFDSFRENNTPTERVSNEVDFLYANANNQMALNDLLYRKKEISKDSLFLFYNKLDSINENSPKGVELLTYINTEQIKIGDKYRDIWGYDLNGEKHKLSDYYGKIILLDFWSPYCPYSIQQHEKELPKLVQKYNQEDFILISYFIDKDTDGLPEQTENQYINWINISDLQGIKGKNISEYDVTGTPNSFLIDKNGMVVKSFEGFDEGKNNIEKEIDKLLKTPK